VLATTTAALAGCGGGSGKTYTLAATKKCLNASGAVATNYRTRLLAGSKGDLDVGFGYGSPHVIVAFGKDKAEAKAIQERAVTAAERFESLQRNVILAGTEQTGNVFLYSAEGPLTVVTKQKVDACLR
jgi:hypothetical protein